MHVRAGDSPLRKDHGHSYEQSVTATPDLVGQLTGMDGASAAVPDIGAAANSVCPEYFDFEMLGRSTSRNLPCARKIQIW